MHLHLKPWPAKRSFFLTAATRHPSLATAELELEEGDILTNKQRVWDNAGEQAALFRAHLEQLREEGFDFEKEYEMQAAGGAH